MSKIVSDSHVTGMKGTNLFERYCLHHQPVIIFKETLKSDFGIDADLEMMEKNENGKTTPTGEIIKVQVKTDGTGGVGKSYIRNSTQNGFDFYASKEDLDYWIKYKTHGYEVLLVVVDAVNEKIYCRKVIETDIGTVTLAIKKKKSYPIQFDKEAHLLETGKSDFRERFSNTFRSRVNYNVTETIVSNLMKFQKHPRYMYAYKSKYKDNRAVRNLVTSEESELSFGDCPFYIAYGSIVYTFHRLGKEYALFKSKVLIDDNPITYNYSAILESVVLRRHYVELLNEYFRDDLRKKRLFYSRQYKRFYFSFNPEKDEAPLTVKAKTKIREAEVDRKVVTWHEYGQSYKFYRHLAFSLHFLFIEDTLYATLGHKYFFTEDGRKALPPLEITKFTNFLTARVYNDAYYGWLRFWWIYLSKDSEQWDVFDYNGVTIKLQSFYAEDVPFGIPMENKVEKVKVKSRKKSTSYSNENTLF
ncbi:DUF4365 domain-containing protein [Pseudobacter ginsenosidimutans]|uniref:Uncharacterized protein DUF4365 n=1 Tax=Pseudobacter ginsenosidimutans TaxID=661488 RepID=A0A4Q7N5G3_9BACT|nr:DUF4365 domain-containing protein [Pseudobacter ginsenosidimutans]QEC44813.1 DUF4365 domain-containing protein [Pseudobacter ginsenosidimutans]RZS76303.1 uncharacterized protein DUF4365 [Pseudobacter ginsenosidimutans]